MARGRRAVPPAAAKGVRPRRRATIGRPATIPRRHASLVSPQARGAQGCSSASQEWCVQLSAMRRRRVLDSARIHAAHAACVGRVLALIERNEMLRSILRCRDNICSHELMRAIEPSEPHRSPQTRSGACRTSRRGQLAIPTLLRSSAAPRAKHEATIAAWQPLRRGTTPHASRRWRRGGPFTAARRRPSAAHRRRRPFLSAGHRRLRARLP